MSGIGDVHWEGIVLALSENPTLPVAFAWAGVPSGDHQGLIAASVRVGEEIQIWHYDYDRLVISTETLLAREVAARLSNGRVTPAPEGPFTFPVPQANEGASSWHASDLDVGMFGPYPTPCLYFNVPIQDVTGRSKVIRRRWVSSRSSIPSNLRGNQMACHGYSVDCVQEFSSGMAVEVIGVRSLGRPARRPHE